MGCLHRGQQSERLLSRRQRQQWEFQRTKTLTISNNDSARAAYWPPFPLSDQACHLRQSLVELGRILAAAAGHFGFTAAFATDDRSNRLDDVTGLDLAGCGFGNRGQERHASLADATKNDDPFKLSFQRIDHRAQMIAVGVADAEAARIKDTLRREAALAAIDKVLNDLPSRLDDQAQARLIDSTITNLENA